MQRTDDTESRLIETISGLSVHAHLALLYSASNERLTVLRPYLRLGLERHERCLHVVRSDDTEEALRELSELSDAAGDSRGALSIASPRDFHPPQSPFDPAFFFSFLKRMAAEAQAAGFNALRFSDEKGWALECGATLEELMAYEAQMNDFTRDHDVLAMCLYRTDLFSAETLFGVIQTHPMIIFNNVPLHNFNYLRPDEFLGPRRVDHQVERLLEGMSLSEEMHDEIRMQRSLLQALFLNTSDGVFIKDVEGRVLMINPAGARFLGKTVEEVVGRTEDEIVDDAEAKALLAEVRRRALQSQEPVTMEVSFAVGGVTATFLTTAGRYIDDGGRVIGIYGIARDITERKRRESETAAFQESLRSLAIDRSLVEEQERRRIASALHDQIGQTLALAKIKLTLLERNQSNGLVEELRQINELISNAISHTRSLTVELSPPALYELGLHAALSGFFDDFEDRHGLKIIYHYSKNTASLPEDLRVVLYQAVRELLINVTRHAGASRVEVVICEVPSHVKIVVTDNGVGFNSGDAYSRNAANKCFGLFNLRERLKGYAGELEINSTPGSGTSITITVPLHRDTAA